ncbi:MAG TPA: ArsR family transcriptional regulator [Bacteroidia bacterium]|nr:ArsR family transcriptional regulator [Bacteroidia bacterium]
MWNQKKECEEVADIFKTISHADRIAILSYICDCNQCTCRVKNIYEKLNLSQPSVSRHLSLMKKQNIVKRISKDGDTYFTLNLKSKIVRCIQDCVTDLTKAKTKK